MNDVLSIIKLFTDEAVSEYSIKDSSRGDNDFREAIFVTGECGKRLVIKLACESY